MHPEVIIVLVSLILATVLLIAFAYRFFRLRERKLKIEAGAAAQWPAPYASQNGDLEQRVRVLERIITDSSVQTANQIEALRDKPRIASGDQIR